MKTAIISDIHSNVYALEAVVNDSKFQNTDQVIFLGDLFGYYPWASKTHDLYKGLKVIHSIKGNHDQMVLDSQEEDDSVYSIAIKNRIQLEESNPEALSWLRSLDFQKEITLGRSTCLLSHGTPNDPSDGRFYPDDTKDHDWFAEIPDVLFTGHTHYPIHKILGDGKLIVNPGSVGQPRDGNLDAAWGIWDDETNQFEQIRTPYDRKKVIDLLMNMNWNKRAIFALEKDRPGALNIGQ